MAALSAAKLIDLWMVLCPACNAPYEHGDGPILAPEELEEIFDRELKCKCGLIFTLQRRGDLQ